MAPVPSNLARINLQHERVPLVPVRAPAPPPAQPPASGAELVQRHTRSGSVDTHALASEARTQSLSHPGTAGRTTQEVLAQLDADRRDDFARDYLSGLSDPQMQAMAKTPSGVDALIATRNAVRQHNRFFDSGEQADRAHAAIEAALPALAASGSLDDAMTAVALTTRVNPEMGERADNLSKAVLQALPPGMLESIAANNGATRGQLAGLAGHLLQGSVHSDERSVAETVYRALATASANNVAISGDAQRSALNRVQSAEAAAARTLQGLPPLPAPSGNAEVDAAALKQWAADVHQRFTQPNREALVTNQMTRYLELRGDAPRLLSGPALSNEIGVAMGLMPNRAPANAAEQALFEQGRFTFYQGDELKAIETVTQQISAVGGPNARVTTLPIVYDSAETGLPTTLPLFRVEGDNGNVRFIDHSGRYYENFGDWRSNNQLPPGTMSYPVDGHLAADYSGRARFETANTPQTADTFWEEWGKPVVTGLAIAVGVVGGAVLIVGTGGLAAVGISAAAAATLTTAATVGVAASTAYFVADSGATLLDRQQHRQSLSLSDPQARAAWLQLGASSLSFAAVGAGAWARAVTPVAASVSQGSSAANAARTLGIAATYADTAAMGNLGVQVVQNWDQMSASDRLLAAAQFGFWGTGMAVAARQSGGVRNLYGLHDVQYAVTRFAATHPITDPAVMAQRRQTALDYMTSIGVTGQKAQDFLNGVDLRYPVQVVQLRQGDTLHQMQHRDNMQGKWYSLTPSTADRVGVAATSTLEPPSWNQGLDPARTAQPKVEATYVLQRDLLVLQSRAKPVADNWSLAETTGQAVPVRTLGGETQIFFTDGAAVTLAAPPHGPH